MHTKHDSFHYFYITYVFGPGIFGNMVLKQKKPEKGSRYNGMNISNAHDFIMNQVKMPVVVIFYERTNEHRYKEWRRFLQLLPAKFGWVPDKKAAFQVLTGEGKSSPPKGELQAVPTPSTDSLGPKEPDQT